MIIAPSAFDFSAIAPAMQSYVDRQILSGVSSAVLYKQDLVHCHTTGFADVEYGIELKPDHLFRIYSNTKLITTMAVMLLMEDGALKLDEVIEQYLPQLGNRQVLLPGASDISQTEPAKSSITIRQMLCHTSGLSYGLLDHGSTIYKAYVERKVLDSRTPLTTLVDALEELPLHFHPGTAWEYSIASDVLGRLVEVVSGKPFDVFIQERIFNPLAMHDTGFWVEPHNHHRVTSYYAGMDPQNALNRGLKKLEKPPFNEVFLSPVTRLSGGGGLVSSMADMLSLMRSFLPDGKRVLQEFSIQMMMQNQLPQGWGISFPTVGNVPGKGFGLGGAVTLQPSENDPANSEGEFEWGGMAGTHWWISPRHHMAGILMTQRLMGFWHPYSFEFKKLAYQAIQNIPR